MRERISLVLEYLRALIFSNSNLTKVKICDKMPVEFVLLSRQLKRSEYRFFLIILLYILFNF